MFIRLSLLFCLIASAPVMAQHSCEHLMSDFKRDLKAREQYRQQAVPHMSALVYKIRDLVSHSQCSQAAELMGDLKQEYGFALNPVDENDDMARYLKSNLETCPNHSSQFNHLFLMEYKYMESDWRALTVDVIHSTGERLQGCK